MLQLVDLLVRFHNMFLRHQPSPIDWQAYRRAIESVEGNSGFQGPAYLSVSPARCATTWLFEELRRTASLRVADVKETNYFSYGYLGGSYSRYFPNLLPGEITGDISPTHAFLPRRAIEQITQVHRKLRILIVLREPVARVWSHMLFDLLRDSCYNVPRSEIASIPENVLLPLIAFYDSQCRYDVLLRHWFENHPPELIHVEWFDNIAAAPEVALRNILAFLGTSENPEIIRDRVNTVDSSALVMPPRIAAYLNELHAYRMPDLNRLVSSLAGLELPAAWHKPMPAIALEPVAILKKFHGYDIYYHAGAYHRVPAGGVLSSAVVSGSGFFEALPFENFDYQSVLERLMSWLMAEHRRSMPASDSRVDPPISTTARYD
jgi:hypothetical protein